MNSVEKYYDEHFLCRDTTPDHFFNDCVRFGKKNTMEALDLGTGDGVKALCLAKNGYQVFGVDVSGVAINKARDNFAKNNLVGHFEKKDLRKVEIPENRYDFIVCAMTAHYLEKDEIIALVNKIKKGLSSQGVVFFSILSIDDPQYKGRNLNYLSNNIKTFMSKSEVLELFNDLTLILLQDLIRPRINIEPDMACASEDFLCGNIVYVGKNKTTLAV